MVTENTGHLGIKNTFGRLCFGKINPKGNGLKKHFSNLRLEK